MRVACYNRPTDVNRNYRKVAVAMAQGIAQAGDYPIIVDVGGAQVEADVGVIYGWKFVDSAKRHPKFVYFDLGYWHRSQGYYRYSVGGWSPHSFMDFGADDSRLHSFGVRVRPWAENNGELLVLGAKRKACGTHDIRYMRWEVDTVTMLRQWFPDRQITYRPKPNDQEKQPINGAGYAFNLPSGQVIRAAAMVLSHHSNASLEALAEGVPMHCTTGAALSCSTPFDRQSILKPRRDEGKRRQVLNDAAWLQFSLAEMQSGACWSFIRERGLV